MAFQMCHYNFFSVSVFVQSSDIVNKSTYIKILLAAMPSVFNLKKKLFFHFKALHEQTWSAESVPTMWARQWNGSDSVYASSDSKYVTRTLSQFHPCKPGNLLCWHDGVQKLQCWQKRCLPFFFPCVALLDRLSGWGLKWKWNHCQRL